MIFKRLKRYEKPILFGITALIALSFGISGEILLISSKKDGKTALKIFGRDISENEFLDKKRHLKILLVDPILRLRRMYGEVDERDLDRQLDSLVIDELVYLEKAKTSGLHVGKEEVANFIRRNFFQAIGQDREFKEEAYFQTLENAGVRVEDFEKTVAERILRSKYEEMMTGAEDATFNDVFNEYKKKRSSKKIRFFTLSSLSYRRLVPTPLPVEVARYFDSEKDNYKIPPRIQFDYVLASRENLKKDVQKPSEAELKEYYEKNKESYLLPSVPSKKEEEKEKKYKPFDDVRQQIEDRMLESRANDLALRSVDKVYRIIEQMQVENRELSIKDISFEEIAKKNGLIYDVTPQFSYRDKKMVEDKIGELQESFENLLQSEELRYSSLPTSKGWLIYRLLKKIPEEYPPLTQSIKLDIEEKIISQKAYENAKKDVDEFLNSVSSEYERLSTERKLSEITDLEQRDKMSAALKLEAFVNMASKKGYSLRESSFFNADEPVPELNEELVRSVVDSASRLVVGERGFGESHKDFCVFNVIMTRVPNGDDFESEHNSIRETLRYRRRGEARRLLKTNLYRDAKIQDFRKKEEKSEEGEE